MVKHHYLSYDIKKLKDVKSKIKLISNTTIEYFTICKIFIRNDNEYLLCTAMKENLRKNKVKIFYSLMLMHPYNQSTVFKIELKQINLLLSGYIPHIQINWTNQYIENNQLTIIKKGL